MTAAWRKANGGLGLRGWMRAIREALAQLHALDVGAIERKIAAAEEAFREVRVAQLALRDQFLAGGDGRGAQRPISPFELKTADRYALEDRCRALTNPIYLGDHTALCRMLGYCKIYLDTTDTGFGSHLLLDGFWEMWLTMFFARAVEPGMTVIDVGANYGYYTLLFGTLVGKAGRVYAVEPNPAVTAKLRRSITLNGLAGHTTLIEAAAGNLDGGEASLYVPYGEPKNGTIVAAPESIAPGAGSFYRVPRIRLDCLAATAPRIDLVKIDAEGAEEDIVAGMEAILRRDRPKLLLEFNPARYSDPAGFIGRLNSLYGRMRYIDFAAAASELAPQQVLNDNSGEDWLLLFDDPAGPPVRPGQALSGAVPR